MGAIKFACIINNTCSFADRKQKFNNTLHSGEHLNMLAQTHSYYKYGSPFSSSCYFVHLNISHSTALH